MAPKTASKLNTVPRTIWMLGFATLLLTFSSLIVFNTMPLYLTLSLGTTHKQLGFLEGFVEGSAWIIRIFSGMLSDYFHRRKPLILAGFGIAALVRPLFIFNPGFMVVTFARFVDRISNGLQATPRDALVGDLAPKELKGACFGVSQTLRSLGACLGAGVLMILIWKYGQQRFELFFGVASIAVILAVLLLFFFVQDPTQKKVEVPGSEKSWTRWMQLIHIEKLGIDYWKIIFVAVIYTLSQFSGAFFILRANDILSADWMVPGVMLVQNFASSFAAYPVGQLSDRFSRNHLLAGSFGLVILSNLFLGLSPTVWGMAIGIALWGIQLGVTQSLLLTKIADTAPKEMRATGFGVYYFMSAIGVFFSNLITGHLSHEYGQTMIFAGSGVFAALAIVALLILFRGSKAQSSGQ